MVTDRCGWTGLLRTTVGSLLILFMCGTMVLNNQTIKSPSPFWCALDVTCGQVQKIETWYSGMAKDWVRFSSQVLWMHSSNCRPPAGFTCLYLYTLILPANLKQTKEPLQVREPEEFLIATFAMWVRIQVAMWGPLHSFQSHFTSTRDLRRNNIAGQVQNSRKAHPTPQHLNSTA